MNLESIERIVFIAWPLSEAVLGMATRSRRRSADVRDRGSLATLWITIFAACFCAVAARFVRATAIHVPPPWMDLSALVLVGAGLVIRWTAIVTLGRMFSSNVAIQEGHRIVRAGLYEYLRHPSYTGMLVSFVGLGVYFRNWLSLALLVVPITAAVMYRIRVEEASLLEAFGQEYLEYSRNTKRLVPGLY